MQWLIIRSWYSVCAAAAILKIGDHCNPYPSTLQLVGIETHFSYYFPSNVRHT